MAANDTITQGSGISELIAVTLFVQNIPVLNTMRVNRK